MCVCVCAGQSYRDVSESSAQPHISGVVCFIGTLQAVAVTFVMEHIQPFCLENWLGYELTCCCLCCTYVHYSMYSFLSHSKIHAHSLLLSMFNFSVLFNMRQLGKKYF